MSSVGAVIAGYGLFTPYGIGVDACWEGLMAKQCTINECTRFDMSAMRSKKAAFIPELGHSGKTSLFMQMVSRLFEETLPPLPEDTFLLTASTTGEIDYLEKKVLYGQGDAEESALSGLTHKVAKAAGIKRSGLVISAACASSLAACARGLSLIRSGVEDCILVVAGDVVSEFVFSGFSSLMALDVNSSKPFDKERAGLSLGEAAGYVLLMSRERAEKEGIKAVFSLTGSGQSNDANHMTGPSRDGAGLSRAVLKALESAEIERDTPAFIAAHGTGTQYNDSMEMKGYKKVFSSPLPVFSVKGAMGHPMAGAGLVQLLVAVQCLKTGMIPPTVGLSDVDPEADGWASPHAVPFKGNHGIVVNAGFGGINAALCLEGEI